MDSKPVLENEQVVVQNLNIPGNPNRLIAELSDRFIGCPIEKHLLNEISQVIREYYVNEYHPFVEIAIMPQEISNGKLTVNIQESKVAKIKVEDAEYTHSEFLTRCLNLEPMQSIDTHQVRKNLDFMNRNPFRKVDLIYSPGIQQHTTDVTLLVKDRRPLRVYAGTNNTGVATTQRGRFFVGMDVASIYGFDQFFAYQYTAAYTVQEFQAHTLQYTAYLPWKHILKLFGGYSSIQNAELTFPATTNRGFGGEAAIRYSFPISTSKNVSQTLGFGFDFKRTNNTVEFSESYSVIAQNVNLSQFVGKYSGIYETSTVQINFEGELNWSPGAILPDETNAAYQTLRPNAQNQWVYIKGMLDYVHKLSRYFQTHCTFRGQFASQNLLPSEQIGLGGPTSVRGYDERQLNYDSGLIANVEMRVGPFSIAGPKRDAFQLLAFLDLGYGGNHNLIPTEKKSDYLLGIGPGARYTLDPWLTAGLDLGFKLHNESTFTGGSAMWNFNMVLNY